MIVSAGPTRQHGVVALVILFVIIIGAASLLVSAFNHRQYKLDQDRITAQALAQAKAALIAFATAHATLPGRLPCPEDISLIGTPYEGKEYGSCSNTTAEIGRLPWRTLGLDGTAAASGEPLWYVRSPGFQSRPINSDTPGKLKLDGIANAAVALIIAPGPPLASQSRQTPTAIAPPDIIQYLEHGNAGGEAFQSSGPADTFNDQVLSITSEELFRAVGQRVAREARMALQAYYADNGFFPNPASFADPTCLGNASSASNCLNDASTCNATVCRGRIPANMSDASGTAGWINTSLLRGTISSPSTDWFQANGWRESIYYAVAPACAEGTSACSGSGHLQVRTSASSTLTNIPVVVISAGPALTASGQSRDSTADKTTLAKYLEDINLAPLSNIFSSFSTTTATPFNDSLNWQP